MSITKTTLRDPVITDAAAVATINLDTNFGDMPVGARVFYTLDGTDPGDDGTGNPIVGTEYTGPFTVKGQGTANVPVHARVYGPSGFEHWFDTSDAILTIVPVPPVAVTLSQTVSTSSP